MIRRDDEPTTCFGDEFRVSQDKRWLHRAIWIIFFLALFRVCYALLVPFDLVHDEAYYWDWSRQLDWGYYSKPPMVAWLIALSTSLGGSSELFVRLPAVFLGTGVLVWMYLLTAHFYGQKPGFCAVCVAAATPGNAAMSLLMTIDAPFLFCWGAALFAFWRMFEPGSRRRLWLMAGVAAVGLGLLSKQMMIVFPVLGGVYLLSGHEDRKELLRSTYWLWFSASCLFLVPVLWWNHRNGWVTIQHTLGHFGGEGLSVWRRLIHCGEFLGGQLGVVSPVTFFVLVAVLWAAVKTLPRLERKERFLFTFSGLPLIAFLVLSLIQEVEPNWPAAFYLAAIVLAVGVAVKMIDLPVRPEVRESSIVLAVAVGAAFVAVTYLVPFGFGLEGSNLDFGVRLRGWRQLGEAVGARIAALPKPDQTFVMTAEGRALASELAFYLPNQPHVYLWTPGSEVLSQYDIWGGPRDKAGWDALIVTKAGYRVPSELSRLFERVSPHGQVEVSIGAGRRHAYHVWHGVKSASWPKDVRGTSNGVVKDKLQ